MMLDTILMGCGLVIAVTATLWAMKPTRRTNPFYV